MKNFEKAKVLVIRVGAIGDVVHTTNVVHSIKKKYPNSKIYYLTSDFIKPLLVQDPDLEYIFGINKNALKPFSSEFKKLVKKIKEEKFDIAINLQPSMKTRLLVWFSGIKKQLIYKKTFKLHAVDNFWLIAKKYFKEIEHIEELTLYLDEKKVKEVKEKFFSNIQKPLVVFNAGGVFSKRKGRTYPLEKWIQLGKKLQEKYGANIVITGSKEDYDFLKPLSEIKNSIFLVGELSLEESACIFKLSNLMLSGDSGPLHIASALGTKTIGLFGSMPISRTGQFGNLGKILTSKLQCIPCNRRKCRFMKNKNELYAPCMEQIEVEDIIKTVDSIFLEGVNLEE